MTESVATENDFVTQWQQWHTGREQELAAPLGWLSITQLEWLDTKPARFDKIPGTWWFDGSVAYLRPGDNEAFEPRDFALEPTGPGELIDLAGTHVEVARRGDGYVIRVHDPSSPVLQQFRGVPAFAADPRWVLRARFEPYAQPRPVTVGAVAEGLAHVYTSPGELVIHHDGAEYRLIAFNGKPGALSVLFTDATSGVTTYGANRSLAVAISDDVARAGGAVEVDFNRATNLPCAFIDYATCPLPPAGNRLPFEVNAGEQIPLERRAPTGNPG